MSPGVSCWEKEKAQDWCQSWGSLPFRKKSSHSFDNLSDHLGQVTGAEKMMTGRDHTLTRTCLARSTPCFLVQPKLHVKTSGMDLEASLGLFVLLPCMATSNKSPFPAFCFATACLVSLLRTGS